MAKICLTASSSVRVTIIELGGGVCMCLDSGAWKTHAPGKEALVESEVFTRYDKDPIGSPSDSKRLS